MDNASLVAPTFKPGAEGAQSVISNATQAEDIKYLVTSPGVMVAEIPVHNESSAVAPPGGVVEEVEEATPQSVPVKLIKGEARAFHT